MAETVKLPVLGEVNKKTAVIGVGAAAGISIFVYIRHRNAQNAAQATAGGSSPASGTDSGIDPSTGIPYADEGGSSAIDPATGIPYAEEYGGGYSSFPGGGAGYVSPPPVTTTSSSGPQTNEDWITTAESVLPGNTATIQTALVRIFGGLTVTHAQKNIYDEAVGIIGPPPVAPPPIKLSDTGGQPQPPPPGGHKVTVPNVVGERMEEAQDKITAAGLRPRTSGTVAPHREHHVIHEEPKGGTKVNKGSVVTIEVRTG